MLQSIDKTTLGYAAVFGLQKETHLVGTDYSWLGALFYLGYLVWEYPTALLLQRFHVGRVMSITVGIVLDGREVLLMDTGYSMGYCSHVSFSLPRFRRSRCSTHFSWGFRSID